MNDKDMRDRLSELEAQLAFQEDTVQTLNQIVARQALQLEKLTAGLEELLGHVQDLSEVVGVAQADDKPPPHY